MNSYKFHKFTQEDTLKYLFHTICHRNPDKIGLVFDDEEFTFKAFYEIVQNLSAHFVSRLNIKKGDRVAIVLPNCKEYIFTYFALFNIGAWAVPINTRWEKPEITNVVKDAMVHTIIFADQIMVHNYVNYFDDMKDTLSTVKNLVMMKKTAEGEIKTRNDVFDFHPMMDVCEAPFEMEEIFPEDIAMLCYTSGTTGHPKGVMVPHGNYVKTSLATANTWGIEGEISLSIAPLYAAQGFLAVLIEFTIGSTINFLSTFNPNEILKHISKGKCTAVHTQPTMWTLLLSSPVIQFANFSNLRMVVVSGSLCTQELARKIEEVTKCRVLNGYGLIEATGVVTITRNDDPEDIRTQTVGRAIPGVEMKIVDENRVEVPKGTVGELATRGFLMTGYLNQEAKTRDIIDADGWLYSGDLARYYDDENISIMGRCKDMIIRGGFNIYPVDIEDAILQLPKVQDVSVVGKPHPVMDEQTVAFVVPKAGEILEQNEIRRFCMGKIANYKVPDEIVFISQMPIILAGKVEKNTLRKWAVEGVPEEYLMLYNH